jgi:hypothetical protein
MSGPTCVWRQRISSSAADQPRARTPSARQYLPAAALPISAGHRPHPIKSDEYQMIFSTHRPVKGRRKSIAARHTAVAVREVWPCRHDRVTIRGSRTNHTLGVEGSRRGSRSDTLQRPAFQAGLFLCRRTRNGKRKTPGALPRRRSHRFECLTSDGSGNPATPRPPLERACRARSG